MMIVLYFLTNWFFHSVLLLFRFVLNEWIDFDCYSIFDSSFHMIRWLSFMIHDLFIECKKSVFLLLQSNSYFINNTFSLMKYYSGGYFEYIFIRWWIHIWCNTIDMNISIFFRWNSWMNSSLTLFVVWRLKKDQRTISVWINGFVFFVAFIICIIIIILHIDYIWWIWCVVLFYFDHFLSWFWVNTFITFFFLFVYTQITTVLSVFCCCCCLV